MAKKEEPEKLKALKEQVKAALAVGIPAAGELHAICGVDAGSLGAALRLLPDTKGRCEGIAFIDSTLLAVCHPKRSRRHKLFAGLAH